MKFLVDTYKKSMLCFWFNPILMLVLFAFCYFEKIDESTPLLVWISSFIEWRYSIEPVYLMLLTGIWFCLLSLILIKLYPNIRRYQKNRLAISFDIFASLSSNILMFLSGFFVAWTFGSHLIEFIEPVPTQEITIFLSASLAIIIRYLTLKAKHSLLLS